MGFLEGQRSQPGDCPSRMAKSSASPPLLRLLWRLMATEAAGSTGVHGSGGCACVGWAVSLWACVWACVCWCGRVCVSACPGCLNKRPSWAPHRTLPSSGSWEFQGHGACPGSLARPLLLLCTACFLLRPPSRDREHLCLESLLTRALTPPVGAPPSRPGGLPGPASKYFHRGIQLWPWDTDTQATVSVRGIVGLCGGCVSRCVRRCECDQV